MDKNQFKTTKTSTRLERVRNHGFNDYFIWSIEANDKKLKDEMKPKRRLMQNLFLISSDQAHYHFGDQSPTWPTNKLKTNYKPIANSNMEVAI